MNAAGKAVEPQIPSRWRRIVVYGLLGVVILLSVAVGYGLGTMQSHWWLVFLFTLVIIVGMQISYFFGLMLSPE